MARQQSKAQRQTVHRVMHEFKHGELKRARGGKVKNPKQAVAIALHEAGASKSQSPQEKRASLRRTKERERRRSTARDRREPSRSGKTRAELYSEAKRLGIPGRSKMNKAALERALRG